MTCLEVRVGTVLLVTKSVVLQSSQLLSVPVGATNFVTSGASFVTVNVCCSQWKRFVRCFRREIPRSHVIPKVDGVIYVTLFNGASVGVEEAIWPV